MANDNFSESSQIESANIGVDRTSATVKGGRRFSFGALVVVGDRRGKVGFGYGKSNEVPAAIEKAEKYARKAMVSVPLMGTTIPHQVEGTFSASKVRLVPAAPGTGVVAGGTVRTILEKAGITDCLTKCYGSTNKRNIVKAVFAGLEQLRQPGQVASLRKQQLETTEIEAKIEKGKRFMPSAPKREKARGPVNTVDDGRKGGRGRGRGGPGGGRGGRGGQGGGQGGHGGQGGQGGDAAAPQAGGETQAPAAS
jgi:small subunit ribosomal protein S5